MKLSFIVSAEFEEEEPLCGDTLKFYADRIRDVLNDDDCGQTEDFDVEPFDEEVEADPITAAVDAALQPLREQLIRRAQAREGR